MKTNFIKILTFLLTLSVIFMFVGCAQTPTTTTTTNSNPTTTSEAKADPFGKYDPAITIRVVKALDSNVKFDESNPDTKSLTDNVWSHTYEDMLGIKLDYMWTPSNDQYNQKWITSIATGDIPDMGWVDGTIYKMLIDGGMVEDMTQYYADYASDYYKAVNDSDGGETIKFMTFEGKLMGLPLTGAQPDGVNLLYMRKDWLDKVNKPAPKTIDELMDVARAFKAAKLGGDDTYGFCMGPYEMGGQCDWEGFLNGMGAFFGLWLKDSSGNLAYSTIQPEMRTAILKLREAYSEGLISKEFAVNGNISQDLVAGKVGISYGTYWAPVAAIQDEMNKNPDSRWITLPLPTIDGSPMKTQAWANGQPGTFFVVRKGYEHPEAAVKIVNLGFKLDVEQPMKYNFNQDTQIQVHIYRLVAAWEPWRNLIGAQKVWNALETKDTSKLDEGQLEMYNNIVASRAGNGDRSKYGYIMVNDSQDSSYAIINELKNENRIVLSEYKSLPTQLMTDKLGIINGDLYNAILKVISGENITVFDDAVAAWKSNGGDDITKEVNDWYAVNK